MQESSANTPVRIPLHSLECGVVLLHLHIRNEHCWVSQISVIFMKNRVRSRQSENKAFAAAACRRSPDVDLAFLEVHDWVCEKLRLLQIHEGWRQTTDVHKLKKWLADAADDAAIAMLIGHASAHTVHCDAALELRPPIQEPVHS